MPATDLNKPPAFLRIFALLLLAGLSLCSCVYPAYKTLQPSSEIIVRDEAGQPVSSAHTVLIAKTHPSGLEKSPESAVTDLNGKAVFESRHEWRTEVTMMHGSEQFSWHLCIENPGFETYSAQFWDQAKMKSLSLTLRQGLSVPCPTNN